MVNEIVVKVSFLKHTLTKKDPGIVEGDYNTTKLVFDIEEDVPEGQLVFQMSDPDGAPIFQHELVAPEVTLVSYDGNGSPCSLFVREGLYPFELVWHSDHGQLTSAPGWMNVAKRQVIIGDNTAVPQPEEMFSVYIVDIDTLLGGNGGAIPSAEGVKLRMQGLLDQANKSAGSNHNNLTDVVRELIDASPTLLQKNITANGTYYAFNDGANGYSAVTVNVPSVGGSNGSSGGNDSVIPTLIKKTLTENGVYDAFEYGADGFSRVIIDVPNSGGAVISRSTAYACKHRYGISALRTIATDKTSYKCAMRCGVSSFGQITTTAASIAAE